MSLQSATCHGGPANGPRFTKQKTPGATGLPGVISTGEHHRGGYGELHRQIENHFSLAFSRIAGRPIQWLDPWLQAEIQSSRRVRRPAARASHFEVSLRFRLRTPGSGRITREKEIEDSPRQKEGDSLELLLDTARLVLLFDGYDAGHRQKRTTFAAPACDSKRLIRLQCDLATAAVTLGTKGRGRDVFVRHSFDSPRTAS